MSDELLTPVPSRAEAEFEASIRPRKLEEFIGQDQVRAQVSLIVEAARNRGVPPDHLLFSGPPGLGKTSLAYIVANELGATLRPTSGPSLERAGDLAAILTNLEEGDVLFIDEIHRLPRPVEEILYQAMEDFQLDVVIGKGPAARSIRLEVARFTLIGATTRTGLLTSPLRHRFGYTARLEYYRTPDLVEVCNRSARVLAVELEPDAATEVAGRSRGTPRIANRLLRRVRDFAEVKGDGSVTVDVAREALRMFEVDELGLDALDLALLKTLVEKFGGGPTGLTTLAASLSEEPDTIEDVSEPFLLQAGLIQRTPRGRIATEAAFEHLGLRRAPSQDRLL
ncbi:MAG: Holliday junction branch migration DNA helicase RuvB [Actinomycetota bacterium]